MNNIDGPPEGGTWQSRAEAMVRQLMEQSDAMNSLIDEFTAALAQATRLRAHVGQIQNGDNGKDE